MIKFKKLIAKILSSLILLGLIPTVAGAEEQDGGFDYATDAWEILSSVGIFDKDDTYTADKEITRSELVKNIIKLSFYSPITEETAVSGFSDVDASDADSGYIQAAVAAGLIHGYDDGTFRPDEPVTYSQATKMMVSLLGYGVIADLSGGYPYGYTSIAEKLDIFKHTDNRTLDGYVTSDNMMIMLLNMAEADLADTDEYAKGKVPAYGKKGKNLLSEKFFVYSARGIVNANEYTSLLSEDGGTDKGFIKVDDVIYAASNTNASDYLGMRVKMYYYYPDTDVVPELKHIRPDEKDNKVKEIMTKDIDYVENSSKLIWYENGNQKKTASLSPIFYFIKNGRMAVFNKDKLKAEVGTVRLIDNDGDNKYDVVSLMDYTSYVVSEVSTVTGIVNTKQNAVIKLNEDNAITVIKKNGMNASVSDIRKGMVISYAETESGTTPVRTLILSDDNVTGTIEKCSADSITVDGVTYDALPNVLEHIKIGNTATVYLDVFGNAVYSDCEHDFVYGYLNTFYEDEGGDGIFGKIFTENGRWVNLPLAKNVKYNGKTDKKAAVYASIGKTPREYRQLIRYKVNDEAEIIAIETAKELTVMGTDEDIRLRDDDIFRLSYVNEIPSSDSRYSAASKSFMGKISAGADTVIFSVPDQSEDTKPDEFAILGLSDLYEDYKYTFWAYDANEVRTAGAIVITNHAALVNYSDVVSKLLLVTGTGKVVNAQGEVVDAIHGYYGSDEELIFPVKLEKPPAILSHDAALIKNVNELQPGDAVQLVFNSAGDAQRVYRWIRSDKEYSYLGDQNTSTSDTDLYVRGAFIAGEVMASDRNDNRLVVQYTENGQAIQLLINNNTKIYVYENGEGRRGEFKNGSVSDILKGDRVYLSARYLVCKEIIIMR
ncbi:MAG: S-layer homology domain-containing protein [Clostridia bacterium]|nr:S-layer homology domain-containing protein [Clostridia bacterium]